MKLRMFSIMALSVAATLLLASAASAQSVNLRAQVPFDFVVADKTYPAGEYAVKSASSEGTKLVGIRNTAETTLSLWYPTTSGQAAKRSELVFHRLGNVYFLHQVWAEGSTTGLEFARSRGETRMAMNGAKTEPVIVAANIVK